MTNRFVRSGGDGGAWTGTVTTLVLGLAAPTVAGDDIYVAADHSEPLVNALLTLTSLGTVTAPCRIFVANHTTALVGGTPPAAALVSTPTVTVGTVNANGITLAGVVSDCRGLIFSAATGASAGVMQLGGNWNFKYCTFISANTATTSHIRPGNNAAAKTVFDNCSVQFGSASQGLNVNGGEFIWKNSATPVLGPTYPSNLFPSTSAGTAILRGIDLSALAGKTLIASNATNGLSITLLNCKEPPAWIRFGATQTADYVTLICERVDNGAINYTKVKEDIGGAQTTETSVLRTGGGSDGTTPTSWRLDTITRAKAKPDRPFRSTPMVIWNDVIGANRTVTVYGNAATLPTNADIWLEIDYLSSASSTLGTVASTTIATPLTAPASVATDASVWANSLGTAFKLVASLNNTAFPRPGMKGPMTIRVCVGAQAMYCIDWQPVIS